MRTHIECYLCLDNRGGEEVERRCGDFSAALLDWEGDFGGFRVGMRGKRSRQGELLGALGAGEVGADEILVELRCFLKRGLAAGRKAFALGESSALGPAWACAPSQHS